MKIQISPEDECSILRKVLKKQPDLEIAAAVAIAARGRAKYPLTCHRDLLSFVDTDGREGEQGTDARIHVNGVVVSYGQALRYLPASFFPIETEEELISKTIIAACIGREAHEEETKLAHRPISPKDCEDKE